MNKLRLSLSIAALAAAVTSAHAQQPAPATRPAAQATPAQQPAQRPALTAEQQAQIARQDAEIGAAALQIMQMIDANRAGEVWDGASETMKRTVSREDFVRQVAADRGRLGAPAQRDRPVVSRSRFGAGEAVPEGIYLNVASPTKFANQAQPIRELVSFRFDGDRTWRVSGYSVR
ncbi:DUF4019 domain-containing protein [Luteimonas sp. FCS-9]|uniref:DUF4019 domain-containing protein n=1 Tax=Luteimonas sp. FCS-9 TaxID=1547516 RepID=UPI00063E8F59|nr:DUF4019 domain-containing protein [Luteimonas sp. FCS-9]KLJ01752.1 hypothetical protein WQ56_05700 [Luteimonas sp. FCS-9]